MQKSTVLKGLVPLAALFSAQAVALPFQSLDPRSLGMGGVGVASGTSANAGFMNPALLSVAREGEDFSLELPVLGARFSDPDKLLDEVDKYQNKDLEGDLTTAVNNFDGTPASAAMVATAAQAIYDQLALFTNKPLQGEVVGGMVIGIPSKKVGASLTINGYAVGGGLLDFSTADQALVQGIIDDANATADGTDPTALGTNTAILDQVSGTQDVVDKLTSGIDARGAVMTEVGISLSHEVDMAGHDVAVGITPKFVKVTTFDYHMDTNSAEFDTSTGTKEYSGFNLDAGLAKDYGNGWKAGLVVKNLFGNEYDTVNGNTVKIEPQPRLGVSHSNDWLTLAADVDLKENEPAGFESKTQYLGVGAELNLLDWFQFRAGYRRNLSDKDTSMPSIGFGFSPFGIHIDLAAAGRHNDVAAALQLGFRF
jgi:hypothetical protein